MRKARTGLRAICLVFGAGFFAIGHAGMELSVADSLRPSVKSLTRPVYTYHYATRQRIGLPREGHVAPIGPNLDSYLERKVGRYFNLGLEPRPGAMASALYVAVDPVASRAFGGTGSGWALVQIVLPEGFRFVDVRTWEDERKKGHRFSAPIRERLRNAGCAAEFPQQLLTGLESSACREIAVATVRELDVNGILYNFKSIGYSSCGDRLPGAFILLDAGALGQSTLFVAESSSEDGALEDRLVIRELFARARSVGSRRKLPWSELSGAPGREFTAWMKSHLLGCGAYSEDEMPTGTSSDSARTAATIAKDLQGLIKTLGRNIHTYHCTPRARIGLAKTGYLVPNHAAVQPFLVAKTYRYWNLSLPTGKYPLVSALFAGIDPVTCLAFGGVGDGWSMLQIVLEEGTRVIDVRRSEDRQWKFSPEQRRLLASQGCKVEYPVSLLTSATSRPCREIAVSVVSQLRADVILLSFPRQQFESCPDRPEGTFILLNPALIDPVRVKLLVDQEASDDAVDDRLMIRGVFELAGEAGSRRRAPWAGLEAPPRKRVEAWMRGHLLGCGSDPEDRVPAVK